MAAGSTYTPIATTTLGSNQTSVTFSSLGSYTDLVLIINAGSTTADNFASVELNNDTTINNYSWTSLYGNGTTASSARATSTGYLNAYVGIGSSIDTTIIANFQNYSNSSTYKTILTRTSRASSTATYYGTESVVTLWENTAAITSIKIKASSTYSFLTGSTFTLYGIASA
jgi:hypothetical protein